MPNNTCLPCGGSTEFNCRANYTIPVINRVGPAGQMWKIQTPDGETITLSSNSRNMMHSNFEFISPYSDEYAGLRVKNTNSTWNGTTFQCIAFNVNRVMEQNKSAPVTLEVGGECNFSYIS